MKTFFDLVGDVLRIGFYVIGALFWLKVLQISGFHIPFALMSQVTP